MRRRDFIPVLSGAAVWPVAARAQQTVLPAVGALNARLADASANNVAAREATRVPTATCTSRVLGDRATLSKRENSGKVASELRPSGEFRSSTGSDDLKENRRGLVRRLLKQKLMSALALE